MVAFWACEVTATKAAVVTVPEGFVLNVCNATCGADAAEGVRGLGLETLQMDEKPWKGLVAHLGGAKHPWQVKLDLVFGLQHQVKFYLAQGTGAVNLMGYFQPGPPSELFEQQQGELAAANAGGKKGKKRAREEKAEKPKADAVAWDQASTSDSDEQQEQSTTKAETLSKKPAQNGTTVASTPVQKQEQPTKQAKRVKASPSNCDNAGNSASAKKKSRKNRKKAKNAGEAN